MTFELLAIIALWFVAVQFWDIAHFQPGKLLRSVAAFGRFVGGCLCALAALYVLALVLPPGAIAAYSPLAIGTFVAALVAESLIGDDLRGIVRNTFRR